MASGPYWTEQECSLLRDAYASTPNSELIKLFPERSARGVRLQASKMGLRKNHDACEYGTPAEESIIGHLTETEKAYFAGIFDGEGCIRIAERPAKSSCNRMYAVYLQISNTSPALIDWLNVHVPGKVYTCKRKNPDWRPLFSWMLPGTKRVMSFLREIEPYLVIKKEQANLVMNGYTHLSPDERHELYLKVKALKKTA